MSSISDPYAARRPPVPPHPVSPHQARSGEVMMMAIKQQPLPPLDEPRGGGVRSSFCSGTTEIGACMSWQQKLVGLVLVLVVMVITLLVLQVVYSSLSYSQLQSNGHELGAASTSCACSGRETVSSTDLAASIASLVKVYAPNSDDAVIRGIQLPDPANYTPVFDFNEPHSTDLITPYGYAKVANIQNYPATHNQAISQTLFQLELDGSNSPHHHPDAVEILFLFEGTIEVTRVEPNSGLTYTNVLTPNMSVIFPRGHIHFQHNIGNGVARYISSLNSELPGVMSEAQRLCDLPYDAILSMFAKQTASSVWAMCGNAGEPIPSNPIHYLKGTYPNKHVSSSSSTGVGAFFKGPDMKTAKENLRREEGLQEQGKENEASERRDANSGSRSLHGSNPNQIQRRLSTLTKLR